MNAPAWIDGLAVIVSWLGVLVSFVFAQRARRASSEANRIQQEMLELERLRETDRQRELNETRWDCRREQGSDGVGTIVVRNLGPAHAAEVRVFLNGAPVDNGSVLSSSPPGTADVGVNAERRYGITVNWSTPSLYEVNISWRDPTGREREFSTVV